jgi:hypothetical protein
MASAPRKTGQWNGASCIFTRMHRPIHITATWDDPPAASTIGIHVSEWLAIVRDDHPVTIIGPSDGDTPAVIWEFQRQRVVICDAIGRRLYRAPLSALLITDRGCDDPIHPPPGPPAAAWPPQTKRVLRPYEPPTASHPEAHPGQPLPPRYIPGLHASWRGRRPRVTLTARSSGDETTPVGRPILDQPRVVQPEALPALVDPTRITELEVWWHQQPGAPQDIVATAMSQARRYADQLRPWYNRRDADGRPTGLWHAVEELEIGVNLFNGGAAWLEWTWLIYGPDGIIEPVRRSWSAAVAAEPGIARACGHRSIPHPPPWHPNLLVADAAVVGQTTPDPDQPGMVLRI